MAYDPFARGPYPVGVRTIGLHDESRRDRPISVELWYPAIGTCGVSLGGSTDIRVNSLDRRAKATFIAAPGRGISGPFPQRKLQNTQVRLGDWRRPVPTFLLASQRDMLVIPPDLQEPFRQLPGPKRFAVRNGGSHFAARGISLGGYTASLAPALVTS